MRKTMIMGMALALLAGMAAANTLSVTNGAAINGNFGMQVDYSGGASTAFVQTNALQDETTFNLSFVIDPGEPTDTNQSTATFDMGAGGNVRIINIFEDFTPGTGVKVVIFLKRSNDDSAWRLAAYSRPDGAGFSFCGEGYLTGLNPAFGSAVRVDFSWTAGTGANGECSATRTNINGGPTTTIFSRTNLNQDATTLNVVRAGSVSAAELGAPTGIVYFDDFVMTR